jgi:diguanylate cyclase (GGDEF)-like protein
MVRLLVLIALALALAQFIGDSIYDASVPGNTSSIAQRIALDLKTNKSGMGMSHMLEACRQYGVVFCYIANRDLRPTPETEALAGNFKYLSPRQGLFRVGDQTFYHAIVQLPNQQNLHVGLPYSSTIRSLDSAAAAPLALRTDSLHLYLSIGFVIAAVLGGCFLSVTQPAAIMANVVFSDEKNRGKMLSIANVTAAYELQHMYKAFMAYVKSSRHNQQRTVDFQRPLESRIDEALHAKHSPTPTSEFVVPESGPSTYRALEQSLAECTNIKDFRDELLTGLAHTDFKYCVLLQQGSDSAVSATTYVDHRALQLLSRIDHAAIIKLISETNKAMDVGAMSLRRYGFGMLAEYMHLRNVRYSPIKHNGVLIAALIILFDNQMPELGADALIDLDSFCARVGNTMANLLKRQELENASLKDQLTGLPNRKFLQDYLTEKLLISSKELFRTPLSLLLVQPNVSDAIIATHGEAVRDKILREVAEELNQCVKTKLDSKINSQLVRYDVEEFAICLQPFDETESVALAGALQERISKSKTSLGDMFGVSLTIGCATSPTDAREERTLLSRAKLAMRFAEEFKPENQIASAREVPISYEPSKRMADISGELGVLDCAALLQSIGNSQKTGVLSVEDEVGRQYQSVFKAGRLLDSHLGEFKGIDAVVEFVTSFEAGRYNFRLVSDTELEKLSPATSGAPLHPPLDKCLMEAALAEDHLKKAKRHLKETHLMRATPGDAAQQKWKNLETDTRNYNAAERQTMQKILALADGSRTLGHIFSEIDRAPTYLKWHAAAILTDNRLLQSKKVS